MEARCTVWGGADRLCHADVRRPADDAAALYMKRLYRPDFTAWYSTGPIYKAAMLEVEPSRTEWNNALSPCADYLGLNLALLGPLSDTLARLLDKAVIGAENVTSDGLEGIRLTAHSHPKDTLWCMYKLSFIELDGYAPVRIEKTYVDEGSPEALRCTVCTWGDYVRVPGGPWIPCEYRLGDFSTDANGLLRLRHGDNVSVDKASLRPAKGRLTDEELTLWCPLGARVAASAGAEDLLPEGVLDAWMRHQAPLWPGGEWHEGPLEDLVYGMNDPLFTASPERRQALAAELRDRVKTEVSRALEVKE